MPRNLTHPLSDGVNGKTQKVGGGGVQQRNTADEQTGPSEMPLKARAFAPCYREGARDNAHGPRGACQEVAVGRA